MKNLQTYFVFGGILGGLGTLLFVIGCIVLVVKQKNTGSILMLVGAILSILLYFGNLLWSLIAAREGSEFLAKTSAIQNIVGQLPFIISAIGLLLFGIKYVKKDSSVN
ncbi:hypothetical protein [Flagellimonas onchidii]|uniref:hypothetical protein n=1 Tax=Flagellimonas onchidii TaxID=2562684 RepID=UPI0010A5CAC6|nr:hypothetical protein [Allomuricauda onchidii]